jgi:hypothetical protein
MKKINSYKKYSKLGIGHFVNRRILGLKKSNKKVILFYIIVILSIILLSKLFLFFK